MLQGLTGVRADALVNGPQTQPSSKHTHIPTSHTHTHYYQHWNTHKQAQRNICGCMCVSRQRVRQFKKGGVIHILRNRQAHTKRALMARVCGLTNGLGWIIHGQLHHTKGEPKPISNAHSAGGDNLSSLSFFSRSHLHTHTFYTALLVNLNSQTNHNYTFFVFQRLLWWGDYIHVSVLGRCNFDFLSNTLAILESKCFSGFYKDIKRVFLRPHLVPRITALTLGPGKWIPSLPLSFPITRVNLAEPLLRHSRQAAFHPDGAIRVVSSTHLESDLFHL